jgi:phosphoribosylformylglycinamidine synthase
LKAGVLVFPGSNCDADCHYVLSDVLGQDVEYIWHGGKKLDHFDALILPGGFSYGDYLRTGSIARFSPVMESVIKFADSGKLVIGICNGFQILLEANLLPGAMLRNKNLSFICKYVTIRTENIKTPFTGKCKKGQTLRIPIAHNEGNYYVDKEGLKKIKSKDQIVFRYCDEDGEVLPSVNPNGSLDNIAGIVNEAGNVLGMMPHPERSSEKLLNSEDGRLIFESMIAWVKRNG